MRIKKFAEFYHYQNIQVGYVYKSTKKVARTQHFYVQCMLYVYLYIYIIKAPSSLLKYHVQVPELYSSSSKTFKNLYVLSKLFFIIFTFVLTVVLTLMHVKISFSVLFAMCFVHSFGNKKRTRRHVRLKENIYFPVEPNMASCCQLNDYEVLQYTVQYFGNQIQKWENFNSYK